MSGVNFIVNPFHSDHQKNHLSRRGTKKCFCVLSCALLLSALTGCGKEVEQIYETKAASPNFRAIQTSPLFEGREKSFAADLCLPQDLRYADSQVGTDALSAAALYDVTDAQTLFSYGATARVYPASTTKIMTALVALKYGKLNQEIEISERAANPGDDAQRLVLEPGDRMTLEQALHYLMVFSANDVAIAIAENIGGSYDEFVDMMNREAHAIGATGTHFTNPHGLHEEDHYTTAYDLYLILNEAMKYQTFRDIIPLDYYNTTFIGSDGYSKSIEVRATDAYLTGDVETPSGITVLGGKTGTTDLAGHCLIISSRGSDDKEDISVVMHTDSAESLYESMNSLLAEIPQ